MLSTTDTDPLTAMRFERECRALGAVSGHPNIVTVHQAGTTPDGHPYLVMGYEPGGSLGDQLRRTGPLPWAEAAEIGIRMAEALEVAHGAGILHRDVKPDNILNGVYGQPKLTDFGIARLQGGDRTGTGHITASVVHAPPEVLDGHPPSERSDVYSLCSTIHTLITGRPPFHDPADQSLAPLIARIGTQPPPPLGPPVPDALAEVIQEGMAKDPADRIPTARDLAERLRAIDTISGDTTVSARPASATTPPRRRRWLPMLAGAAAAVVVVVAAAVAVAVVAVAAAAWWFLDPSDETAEGAAAEAAVEADPAGPTTTAEASGPDPSPLDATTGTAPNAPTTGSTTDPSVSDGVGVEGPTATELAAALVSGDDLGPGALVLEEGTWDSGEEPDHPLSELAYCGRPPPLDAVGPGANRVLTTDLLATDALVTSSVSRLTSPETARSFVDELVAAADSCRSYPAGGAEITVVSAERTTAGAEIRLVVDSLFVDGVELTTLITVTGPIVATLAQSGPPDDIARLQAIIDERIEAVTTD